MTAVVIAVGSELLRPGRRDTNAEWLIERLLDAGVETLWRAGVGDDADRIAELVRVARGDARWVIVTGGLGPTDDDRTRDGLARALGVPLDSDPEMARHIEAMFTARGRVPSARQALKARRPRGSAWVPNPLGSAPGLLAEAGGCTIVALPGVPAEMKAMFAASIEPALAGAPAASLARATLRIAGRPESWVDDAVRDLYEVPQTQTTILASSGTVELLLTARGRDAAEARGRLAALEGEMRRRLDRDVYGVDRDSLASVVGRLLADHGATVATAESCTGGLLGAAITEVPGSSAWFRGGLIGYANDVKIALAGVPEDVLREHGAVSEPVARALARGARLACGADFGLGITGVAGPDGGTPDKPVGTVHVALDDGAEGRALKLDWPGDRDLIRRRAVAVALDLLRRCLLDR